MSEFYYLVQLLDFHDSWLHKLFLNSLLITALYLCKIISQNVSSSEKASFKKIAQEMKMENGVERTRERQSVPIFTK